MTDNKLTDKQIIEAFEYCSRHYDCSKCPIENLCYDVEIGELVLDLINRQNAEIERLRETIIMGRYTSPIAISDYWHWIDDTLYEVEKEMVGEQRKEDEGK